MQGAAACSLSLNATACAAWFHDFYINGKECDTKTIQIQTHPFQFIQFIQRVRLDCVDAVYIHVILVLHGFVTAALGEGKVGPVCLLASFV